MYIIIFFQFVSLSGIASLIHNEDLHSTVPIVSIAFIRPTHVHVFNDFKLSLQTVVQLNGVIEKQHNSIAVYMADEACQHWELLCVNYVEIYLPDSTPTLYHLETLLAQFRLQKAGTVLGLAAINFMSA